MATKVTIEGSRITPTDKLPAGVRTTVELTPETQKFINRGYAVLISSEELPDEPVDTPDDAQASDSGSDAADAQDDNPDVDPAADAGERDDPEAGSGEGSEPAPDAEPAEKPSRSRRGSKTVDAPEA